MSVRSCFCFWKRIWCWKLQPATWWNCQYRLVRAASALFFSTLHSVTSTWYIEIGLIGSIYTIEIGNRYKSGLSSPGWAVRPLPAHCCLHPTPNLLSSSCPTPPTDTSQNLQAHPPAYLYMCRHTEDHICTLSPLRPAWMSAVVLALSCWHLWCFSTNYIVISHSDLSLSLSFTIVLSLASWGPQCLRD